MRVWSCSPALALMASSAGMEQWILTGGSASSWQSLFLRGRRQVQRLPFDPFGHHDDEVMGRQL